MGRQGRAVERAGQRDQLQSCAQVSKAAGTVETLSHHAWLQLGREFAAEDRFQARSGKLVARNIVIVADLSDTEATVTACQRLLELVEIARLNFDQRLIQDAREILSRV